MKPSGKIQEYIDKRKDEETLVENQEDTEKEQARQNNEEKKNKVKETLKTGSAVLTSIPHVATFSIGLGAGSLIPTLLKEMWEKQKDKK